MRNGSPLVKVFSAAVCAVLAVACGCRSQAERNSQGTPQMANDQRSMYRLRGKVVDAQTLRGLGQARLSLTVRVPTPVGTRAAKVYGAADSQGKYELRVPLSHETMRQAAEIELSAGLPGYEAKTVTIPRPLLASPFHVAPVIGLRKHVEADLPWQPERDTPRTESRSSTGEEKSSPWDWLFPWRKKEKEKEGSVEWSAPRTVTPES
jgi:hypothetical protein